MLDSVLNANVEKMRTLLIEIGFNYSNVSNLADYQIRHFVNDCIINGEIDESELMELAQ